MIRKIFYLLGRILSDLNAINKGKAKKRIIRRSIGRSTGKAFKKFI